MSKLAVDSIVSHDCRMQFESVVKSMLSVGFEEEEIVTIVALLAGVILIGDIVSLPCTELKCYVSF